MTNVIGLQHPIDPETRTEIEQRLAIIESEHNVRVLFACESGSRGWGFASPDSDYDVRFIYVHPLPWYLHVSKERDVIELPISDVLDINGWELRKALGLLKKGNATLIEWLDSPIVYRADTTFLDGIRAAACKTYQPERSFHHYVHMARGNYRMYLRGDMVRLKKYLYVLRPLLATLWIEQGRGIAPMRAFRTSLKPLLPMPIYLTPLTICSPLNATPWNRNMGTPSPSSTRSSIPNSRDWKRLCRQHQQTLISRCWIVYL